MSESVKLLLPGNAKSIMRCGIDLDPLHYGWLLSPARTMTIQGMYGLHYAVDNEVFTNRFEPGRFRRALERIKEAHGTDDCLFVVAPDVVGDARATLARFPEWAAELSEMGYPVALAAQDGLEDLDVPWSEFDALFVGGTTEWKMSERAAALMHEAREQGKHLHVGRVNSWLRVDQLRVKPDSIDGTHWAKRPDKYIRQWEAERKARKWNGRFDFYDSVPIWEP